MKSRKDHMRKGLDAFRLLVSRQENHGANVRDKKRPKYLPNRAEKRAAAHR